jgi:hypothetical protein
MLLAARIQAGPGVGLPVAVLFDAPTVAELRLAALTCALARLAADPRPATAHDARCRPIPGRRW